MVSIWKVIGKVAGWATAGMAKVALKPLAKAAVMPKVAPVSKPAVMPKFQNLKKASRLGWATSEGEMQKLKQSFKMYGRAR